MRATSSSRRWCYGSLGVPFVASNVRAARALADIGTDLANAGESLTTAVHPEALEVVGGRLPLDEVTRITPELERGSAALTAALHRLNDVRDDPYLAPPVRDAVNKVHEQLVQAEGEARRAAAAAKLAPAIFGGDGPRRYLLVVQNNAESRATGGFIGSYGVITAENGKLDVSDLLRTGIWNNAIAVHDPTPPLVAPPDYFRRYNQFSPVTTLQNVNLSPDFPSVTDVLLNLAPQAGVGQVDGVMSVDPIGLAALLKLTGPVTVAGWPTPISDLDVVSVTLRDAYAKFAETPERADFLGDVAQAAVDRATSGTLGRPATIAQVLGGAAHEGHIILGFARPAEQRLAVQLGIAEKMGPIASDAVAVTTSNVGGNKIDYYLQRTVEYHAHVVPNEKATQATVSGDLVVDLDNQAPATGPAADRDRAVRQALHRRGERVDRVALLTTRVPERGDRQAGDERVARVVSAAATSTPCTRRSRRRRCRRSAPSSREPCRSTTAGTRWRCATNPRSTPTASGSPSTCPRVGASTRLRTCASSTRASRPRRSSSSAPPRSACTSRRIPRRGTSGSDCAWARERRRRLPGVVRLHREPVPVAPRRGAAPRAAPGADAGRRSST